MKRTILTITAVALCAGLTACHSLTIPLPGTDKVAKVRSFGQRVAIGGITYGTNGLTVTNYNLDQVSGIQAMSQAINSGIAAGAAAGVKAVVPVQ